MMLCVAAVLASGTLAAPTAGAPDAPTQLGAAVHWFGGYPAPRLPMVGDADGDGLADFLGLYPPDGGILDFVGTSALGKPHDNVQARRPFAADALAAACASFSGSAGAEVLAVLPDGTLHVAWTMSADSHCYGRGDEAGSVTADHLPVAPLWAAAGDVNGDGRPDVVLVGADGGLHLLLNTWSRGEGRRFTPHAVRGSLGSVSRVAMGTLGGEERAALVWLADDGAVRRGTLVASSADGAMLTDVSVLLWDSPGNGLAVGRFTGGPGADVLVGRRLLPGGDVSRGTYQPLLPALAAVRGDHSWLAADLTGDGLDDLVRLRRSGERFVGDDVLLHPNTHDGAASPIVDTDGDGLRDTWELGAVHPGGLDLPALGCSPVHADVICEVQPIEGVPGERLHSQMDRVVAYLAGLPVTNPDGTQGIDLRVIYREPIPRDREQDGWPRLAADFHPAARRGVTHWMLVGSGGGGQSDQMADAGSCGQSALYATFVHEFGHQLGLDHSGHWEGGWSPTYPSLLNYAYSYQLGGDPNAIGYSSGVLASVELDERHLDEYLPAPLERVAYLAGRPYRYHLRPAPDGEGTLIDWNWNGVFGETDIAADINYGYSTYAGDRQKLSKARTAPALASHGSGAGSRLLLLAGDLRRAADGAPEPPVPVSLTDPVPPLRLYLRVWLGADPLEEPDEWSDETVVEADGLLGDPSSAYIGGATWVAYCTADGVCLRRITLDASNEPKIGPLHTVPGSVGAEPTLIPWDEAGLLLLWHGPGIPVEARTVTFDAEQPNFGRLQDLPVTSLDPVGAALSPDGLSLWLGLTEDQDEDRPHRWQVRRLERNAEGGYIEAHREWIGGPDGPHRGERRIVLLCEAHPGFADGRVYYFQCGMMGGSPPSSCHYIGMPVKDQEVHHGWLVRRYNDEWSTSQSGPGACFFRGDIAYAMRWAAPAEGDGSTDVHIGFFGHGLGHGRMGDFDDLTFIGTIGLSHSIPCVAR